MRNYISSANLCKALSLGAVVTLLSVPRMREGGMDLVLYLPAAFVSMTLISGAGTAWGRYGGMVGLFPDRYRILVGLAIGLCLAAATSVVQVCWVEPVTHDVIRRTVSPSLVRLRYPETAAGITALILWTAGFEVFFFQVGGLAFFARLTGSQWMACLAVTVLKVFVADVSLTSIGVTEAVPLFLVGAAFSGAAASVLMARFGLPATMLFTGGINLHHFFACA